MVVIDFYLFTQFLYEQLHFRVQPRAGKRIKMRLNVYSTFGDFLRYRLTRNSIKFKGSDLIFGNLRLLLVKNVVADQKTVDALF